MKAEQRRAYILQVLQEQNTVSVQALSERLETTPVTIRKDLQLLEAENRLRRIPGGAVQINAEMQKMNGREGLNPIVNLSLKKAVAKEAAKMIHDGDSMVVTCGSTTYLTLRQASHCRDLKIITDSIFIAEEFSGRPDYQLIIMGGEICWQDYFVYGQDAVTQIHRYMADKAFITMDGVDSARGISTRRVEGAFVLRDILLRAKSCILLADITKIGREAFYHIGDISIVDCLVTNQTSDPGKLSILKEISDKGVRVIMAAPISDDE